MNYRLVLLLSVLLSVVSAHGVKVENGVSKELAEYRAAHIRHVEYGLTFLIPDSLTQKVRVFETITFDWTGKEDLLIDFQGDSFDGEAFINGTKRKLAWKDEHIVVPKKYLKKHNEIYLTVGAANKSLNRSKDYLYTLFVPDHARSVFPCFDQPDLKARFSLILATPSGWKAIGNAPVSKHTNEIVGCKAGELYTFAQTLPLPTYLFSFAAGDFHTKQAVRDGLTMEALYRENDSAKVAQLERVFDETAHSLRWLEDYTGIPYPFRKLDIIILPGYQFGGMEHPGAIQFNARTIFPGANPTPDELLKRTELIAHEVAHMWFGDLVTMRWFDDVWTKEVFANFLASKISRELYPDVNHDLNFLKMYQVPALAVDRTDGTHPIQQPLANLNQAGLLYGNIIYHKAPVMMRKLEQQMGAEPLRQGLQAYLRRYSFGNATWDDLICILDSVVPQANLKDFSHVWVKEKGLPTIDITLKDGLLAVDQTDPFHRNLLWRQQFKIGTVQDEAEVELTFETEQAHEKVVFDTGAATSALLPNYDGSGYGRFLLGDSISVMQLQQWLQLPEVNRFAAMMTIYENYLMHRLPAHRVLPVFHTSLLNERNELVASSMIDYILSVSREQDSLSIITGDHLLFSVARIHALPSVRQKLLRSLSTSARNPMVLDSLYQIWQNQSEPLLNERDYTAMSYHLAIMFPDRWREITDTQRGRLNNVDDQREFDFISRACNPDTTVLQELFAGLLKKENRTVEPWAQKLLALLNHPSREPFSNAFLIPALDALPEIQRTGDIFFPGYWLGALIGGHRSEEANLIVSRWIDTHPDLPEALMNKLKQASWHLRNMYLK